MNRQERRKMARIKETEARHLAYLDDRQQTRTDALITLYAIGIGLAHHNYYGANADDRIAGFVHEWNKQVCRIHREGLTFNDLKQELLDKTGVNFEVRDE